MNKKRIRQLTGSLLRRAATQPAARYLGPCRALLRQWLEEENYLHPTLRRQAHILRRRVGSVPGGAGYAVSPPGGGVAGLYL